MNILIYIGCSRWTSANRNHAKHIAGDDRMPICGRQYKSGALDVFEGDISEVTCKKCLKIYNEMSR